MIRRLISEVFAGKKNGDFADVFLHIGAPKTGTSAIQRFCIKNRDKLLEHGFYYPEHPLDQNGISGGHSQLAVSMIRGDLEKAETLFQQYFNEAQSNNCRLLLSAEGFYGQNLKFSPLLAGLRVRVIGWFRHPLSSFLSNHNQSIKRHYATQRLADVFVKRSFNLQSAYLNGQYFHGWADCIGDENCHFLPYLDQYKRLEESIEQHFLLWLGIAKADIDLFEYDSAYVNRSYIPAALELKRLCNMVLNDQVKDVCQCLDWSLQAYSDQHSDSETPISHQLTPEQIELFNQTFLGTNTQLAARFPSLQFLLENNFHDDSSTINFSAVDQACLGLDLLSPLKFFSEKYPDEFSVFRSLVQQALINFSPPEYSLLRLAELLALPVNDSIFVRPKCFLPSANLDVMLKPEASAVDFLREMALVMERAGELESALLLISRALELRPQGVGIIKARQRIRASLGLQPETDNSA